MRELYFHKEKGTEPIKIIDVNTWKKVSHLREKELWEMVKKGQARREQKKDDQGKVLSSTIIAEDGTVLGFIDREGLEKL